MKLRVNKRKDGSYFVQKRFLFFWYDYPSHEGGCRRFLEEEDALEEMEGLFNTYKNIEQNIKNNKVDKNYEIKYKT